MSVVRLGNRTSSTFFCRKQPDLCCNSSNTDVEHTSNRLAGCFVVPDVEDAALRVAIFALGIQADNPRSYLQLALQGDSRYNKYMAAVNNRKHELGLVSDVDAFRFAHVLDELLEKAPYSVLLPEPRFIEGEVDWTLNTCAPHYEADFDYWAWRCLLRTYDDLKEAFKLQDFEGGIVEWCDLPEKHYSSSEEDGYMSCNGEAYSSSEEEGYSSSEDEEPEPPSTPDRGFEGSWC